MQLRAGIKVGLLVLIWFIAPIRIKNPACIFNQRVEQPAIIIKLTWPRNAFTLGMMNSRTDTHPTTEHRMTGFNFDHVQFCSTQPRFAADHLDIAFLNFECT